MESGARKLGVLLLRIAIVFVVVALTASEMAFAQDEEKDYWATTGMSESILKSYLTQSRCYTDENSFVGCINAINSLLGSTSVPKILTNKKIEAIPNAKETVRVVEGLKIQNFKADTDKKKPLIEKIKEGQALKAQINKSWKDVYALTAKKQLSTDALFDAALSQLGKEKVQLRLAIAINEYLGAVYDPHTHIESIESLNAMKAKSEESYYGVGMQLQALEDRIVVAPLEGSPAQSAGIKYLDVLTSVNGKPVTVANMQDIAAKDIKGPENTTVTLSVLRAKQTLSFKVVRKKIVQKNIEGKILKSNNTKVGYIKLNSFMEDGLCQKFINIAQELKKAGAESLILDVRNNGGGQVSEVLCMAGSYIDKNEVLLETRNPQTNEVKERIKNFTPVTVDDLVSQLVTGNQAQVGSIAITDSQPTALYHLYGKALVILQNGNSASASELLPGALQAYGRVVTVGERSFGKGTMQGGSLSTPPGLERMNGVMTLGTTARFHFANGTTNQLVGITPDFEVFKNPNPTEMDKFAYREADLYSNAINPGVPTKGIDASSKAKISQCVKARNNVAADYAAALNTATEPDYQLINAREVAACL